MSEITVTRRTPAVAVVTIARPARRNALNLAAWRDLAAAFRGLAGDRTVRLVVLTGAGGHFCAGADISEFAAARADSTSGAEYERQVAAAYAAIRELPQPSVAAIAGACVGGGCAIAMCCDFRVMRHGARFGIPARELGFADALTEGDPVEAAIEFGAAMAANAPLAIAGTKRILHALADGEAERRRPEIEALIRAALDSADYREGAAAFLEKRPARFTGS